MTNRYDYSSSFIQNVIWIKMYLIEDRVKSLKDCSAMLDTWSFPENIEGENGSKDYYKNLKNIVWAYMCTFFSNNEKNLRKEFEQEVNSDF